MREREGEVGEALLLLSHVREGGRSLGHWVNWNKGEEDSEGMLSSSPCHLSHCWGTLPCHHHEVQEDKGERGGCVIIRTRKRVKVHHLLLCCCCHHM